MQPSTLLNYLVHTLLWTLVVCCLLWPKMARRTADVVGRHGKALTEFYQLVWTACYAYRRTFNGHGELSRDVQESLELERYIDKISRTLKPNPPQESGSSSYVGKERV